MGDITKTAGTSVTSNRSEIAKFLKAARGLPAITRRTTKPRLIFAMDATGSRENAWDGAIELQGEMIRAAGEEGLEIAIGYYRGSMDQRKCAISGFHSEFSDLARLVRSIKCVAGSTQIDRLLDVFLAQADRPDGARVAAFVGDEFQEEASYKSMLGKAATLKKKGFRVFMFQEGSSEFVTDAFTAIAEATGGLHARFDPNAPDQLRELMRAVAAYAATSTKPLQAATTPRGVEFERRLQALPPPVP